MKENKNFQEVKYYSLSECGLKPWFCGYFDAYWNVSFASDTPTIQLINTNPKIATLCFSLLKKIVNVKLTQKANPSKSSKEKRWDLNVTGESAIFLAKKLVNFVHGKREQLELILKYDKERNNLSNFKIKMKYLNKTNHTLILNDDLLWNEIGINLEKKHLNPTEKNVFIQKDNFDNINYLAGVFDAKGMFNMNQFQKKYLNADTFTPKIHLTLANKKIFENCYSTLKNHYIGCHVISKKNEKTNRVEWTLEISGVKRIIHFADFILDKLRIKSQQLEMLNLYCYDRIRTPKTPINEIGYGVKMTVDKMNNN